MSISRSEARIIENALDIGIAKFRNEIDRLNGEIKLKDLHIKHLEERLEWYQKKENVSKLIIAS